jgi:OmpA-OmpF porin, OOP family
MHHQLPLQVGRIFLLLVLSTIVWAIAHPSGASAAEPSVEEMIDALSKKSTTVPGAGVPRMRGIGGTGDQKPTPPAGQLQLSVQFELGSANISPVSRSLLTSLGTAMNSPALAGKRFRIEGHTDATGDAEINRRLSTRRARSVQEFLRHRSGVAAARLSVIGKGSSEPIDAADPNAGVNRRVVIVALEDAAAGDALANKPAPPAPLASALVPETAAAGTVSQVRGEASVTRANVSTPIVAGDTVKAGDTISSGTGASVMLQLIDDAKLLVRPGSSVRLTQITNGGPVELRKQSIELARGALRYVTGALGKLRPGSIRFKTPNATVGIRGTDIDIVHAPVTRGQSGAGTYVRVNSGEVELNGADGSLVTLTMNEQAVAAPEGPRLRGGGRAPAARKLGAPANIFTVGELDSLLDGR